MGVERLSREDKEAAVDVLAAAFHDYPIMRHVLADAGAAYDERLRRLVGFFCEKRLARGWPLLGLRAGGDLIAVAGVSEPTSAPWPDALVRARERLREEIGGAAVDRLQRYETESDRDAPAAPHHFLGVVAVHPDHQGRGHARPLLDEVHRIAVAHPDSTGVCLNTETPGNVTLYQHLGYRVLAERDVDGLHTWCMFRDNG